MRAVKRRKTFHLYICVEKPSVRVYVQLEFTTKQEGFFIYVTSFIQKNNNYQLRWGKNATGIKNKQTEAIVVPHRGTWGGGVNGHLDSSESDWWGEDGKGARSKCEWPGERGTALRCCTVLNVADGRRPDPRPGATDPRSHTPAGGTEAGSPRTQVAPPPRPNALGFWFFLIIPVCPRM